MAIPQLPAVVEEDSDILNLVKALLKTTSVGEGPCTVESRASMSAVSLPGMP